MDTRPLIGTLSVIYELCNALVSEPSEVKTVWLPTGDPVSSLDELAAVEGKSYISTVNEVLTTRAYDTPLVKEAEAFLDEYKVRRVRTPEGSRRFGLPIGAVIGSTTFHPQALLSLLPEQGTLPIPEGHIRLYHQTSVRNVPSIQKSGLHAPQEGKHGDPPGLWSGTKPFYKTAGHDSATVEFHVPIDQLTDLASNTRDIRSGKIRPEDADVHSAVLMKDVPPENILAVHEAWQDSVRYMIRQGMVDEAIAGEFLGIEDRYDKATAWLRKHSGKGVKVFPDEIPPRTNRTRGRAELLQRQRRYSLRQLDRAKRRRKRRRDDEDKSLFGRILTIAEFYDEKALTKKARRVRYVRTEEGREHFDQPINSIIIADSVLPNIKIEKMFEGTTWKRIKGTNGQSYEVGQYEEDNKWGVEDSEDTIHDADDEYGALEWLNNHVGSTKKPSGRAAKKTAAKKTAPAKKAPAKKTAAKKGGGPVRHDTTKVMIGQTEVFNGKKVKAGPVPPKKNANPLKRKFRKATPEDYQRILDDWGSLIPPGWINVEVNTNPDDDSLLARGTSPTASDPDKVQSLYGPHHNARRDVAKYQKVAKGMSARGALEKDVDKNAVDDDDAAMLAIVLHMGLRPDTGGGSTLYGQTYGASSLERRHVVVRRGKMYLEFPPAKGKGKTISLEVKNSVVRKALEARIDRKPSAQLFPETTDRSANAYLKQHMGSEYSLKNLRTMLGTEKALEFMQNMTAPKSPAELKKRKNEVADYVASILGNTRAVALGSYIAPVVWKKWEKQANG